MSNNSTTVRSIRRAPLPLRAWFAIAGRLAPSLAEHHAARLFLTPRLRRGRTAGDLHAELLPERAMERRAGEASPAHLELPTGPIPLWSWGRGPTVLLVHGWSGHAGDMAPLAAELVRAGHRAILFDMPGHGHAAPRPTNLVVYLRTLSALGTLIGPLHAVVGHSLGGTATALALGQGILSARRAALLAPAASPWDFSYHFAEVIGLPRPRVAGMVARTEQLVGAKADTLDAVEAVRTLGTPALLVHDPDDPDVPFGHSTKLAEAWPGATLIPAPGVGHRRILKHPGTVARIRNFIAQ
jgi:pimeloyl-ACP methyl ester carboxylesterase